MNSRHLQVRGVSLHVTVQGPNRPQHDRPPAVVAVHGGPGIDGSGLRFVLAPLADTYQLVIPDQRGHGLSDRATSQTWSLDEWADDLAEVIGQLELQRPTVVGSSFGGWVALRHAARHPLQVGSLVLAAQTARLLSIAGVAERMGEFGGPISSAVWLDAHSQDRVDSARLARHCLSLMAIREPGQALKNIRESQIKSPAVNEHFVEQFNSADLTRDAATIACPLTVVVGRRDPFTTPELAYCTAEVARGSTRVRIVDNAAHDLLVDSPDILLEEIRASVAEAGKA